MSTLPAKSRYRLLCATGIGAVIVSIPVVQQGCSDAISAATEPQFATENIVETAIIDELHANVATESQRAGTQLEVAGANDLPDIQPITPGLLQKPPSEIAGDLGVLMIGPQGEQNRPMQAVVVFDRPMVPLSDLDQMNATVPITCGPDLAGKARWAGTTTAVWIPEDNEFPMATRVTCMIPRGTASLDGASLTEDLVWTFQTPALAVTDAWPYDDAANVDPEQDILLVFNQAVDPTQIESFIQVEDAQGAALDIDVSTPKEVLNWRYPEDLSRAVVIDTELDMNTTYNVVLSPGAQGLEGELGTEGTYRTQFETVPPPEIFAVGPQETTDSPYVQIYLELSTQTNGQELASKISISPKPPGEWQPSQDWSSRDWYYGVALAPMTTYTVTVEPGFKDIYGQVYDKGTSWTFTTGHYRPLIDVTQNVEVFPANNPKTLPLRSRNLNNLYANVRAVDTDWLMRNYDKTRTTGDQAHRDGVRIDLSQEVGIDESIHLHELDLSPVLKDGHGLVQVEVWSPDIRRRMWNSQTRKYVEKIAMHRAILQVTNLGATVKIGTNGIHTWVTDLEDGNPVADAQVEVIRAGKVLWTGNSNQSGIAVAPDLTPENWNSWRDPIWVRVTKGADQVLAAGKLNHQLSTWEHGVYAQTPDESESLRTHAFSDRGVYKQGETAHIALSARLTTEKGLRLPIDATFDYTCTDANGGEIANDSGLSLESHGGASFDVALPSDMALGSSRCEVMIAADGFKEWEWVELPVFAYRTPSFRVDVDGPEHAIAGDTLSVNGNGRYLFGAPMIGAEATWSVRATDSNPQPKGWEAFHFGAAPANWWDWEEENWENESSVLVDSGEGVLNKNGQLAVEVKVPVTEAPKTRIFTYEVAVTDVSRQEIANRTQVEVHPAEAYVGLKRSAGIAKAGSKTSFEYVLVDPKVE